jgi:hypothetical protein
MRQLAKGKYKEFFGEYSDHINFVPTSYGKEIDILLLNEIKDYCHPQQSLAGYTIIEMRADKCSKSDLTQTLKYEDWFIKKKCGGDSAIARAMRVP